MWVTLAAAVVVVASLPHNAEDSTVQQLGESQGQKYEHVVAAAVAKVHKDAAKADWEANSHHRVAHAVDHVWKTSDLNSMYDAEMKGKHWHCKHCHQSCKTIKCRSWCHKKFCGDDYTKLLQAKHGIGRVVIKQGQPIIPQYANAVSSTNKYLYEAEKATSDEDFRRASEGLNKVLEEQKEDYNHFDNQQKYADAIDAAAYPDEQEKKAIDDKNYHLEKEEADSYSKLAQGDAKESLKEASANKAFEKGTKATREADKAMGGGDNLMKDVEKDIAAENDVLDNDSGSDKKDSPAMTEVANVAAEVEALGVKVKAAASAASTSSTTEQH